jgi:hypothetical protein
MINWQYFPKSDKIPNELGEVIKCFTIAESRISSQENLLKSNEVTDIVRDSLMQLDFQVEGRGRGMKIRVPVLFGKNGKPEKSFDADAYKEKSGIVLEIEAGRGVLNNQFLKDLFEACVMQGVDYLIIALRKNYLRNFYVFNQLFDWRYPRDK